MKAVASAESKMEKSMFLAAYFGMFNMTLFAQEVVKTSGETNQWERLGVAGVVSLLATAAAVYCFKAYKKAQEDRIADLKEANKKQEMMINDIIASRRNERITP